MTAQSWGFRNTMAAGVLRLVVLGISPAVVMSLLEPAITATIGETVTIKCDLNCGAGTELRFWKYFVSPEREIRTCNETLSALVTQWGIDGVIKYNDDTPINVRTRVTPTASFDLIIQDVSISDTGCYECGQICQDDRELYSNSSLLIVTQKETSAVTQIGVNKVTQEPDTGRKLTALWIFFLAIILVLATALGIVATTKVKNNSKRTLQRARQNKASDQDGDVHEEEETGAEEHNIALLQTATDNVREATEDISNHDEKILAVLENLKSKHILNWTAAHLQCQAENTIDKRQILHHIHGYLRRSDNRKHNDVVHIETNREITIIHSRLEHFIKETIESQLSQGCSANDVLFSLFCAASLAGMATDEHRKECTVTLKIPQEQQSLPAEDTLSFVSEHSQIAGSYRSLVLEYLFARLLWAELQTRRNEELLLITKIICKRVLLYMGFLNNGLHRTKTSEGTSLVHDAYVPPASRWMYENLTSSVADGGDLNALNTNYWIKLIARMHDDINKEILMYNILMTVIFAESLGPKVNQENVN